MKKNEHGHLDQIKSFQKQVKELSTDKKSLNALIVSYKSIESGLNASIFKLKTDHANALVDLLEEKKNLAGELLDAREALAKSNGEAVKALEAGFSLCRDRAIKAGYDMAEHTFQKHYEDLARLRDGDGSSTRHAQAQS